MLQIFDTELRKKTPIWFMRQAGRYLPEYMKIRNQFKSFVDFCLTPDAACEVTIQPLKRFDVDAAILFSDILIIPHAMGLDVNFVKGEGPVVNGFEKVCERGYSVNDEVFHTVGRAVKLIRKELDNNFPDKSLIGFCGAPWTVATYIIEGGSSRDFKKTRQFLIQNPKKFQALIDALVKYSIEYLKIQIANGAEIIKIFDSWAGALPEYLQESVVLNPINEIINSIKKTYPHVKVIAFPKGIGASYKKFADNSQADCIAVDQFTSISWAKENITKKIIQGNLDNYLLLANPEEVKNKTSDILNTMGKRSFIFNLGHGIMPESKISNVEKVIETIRDYDRKNLFHR